MDRLPGESIVAVLGIKYPLRENAGPPTQGELVRAAKLAGVIKRRVRDLVALDAIQISRVDLVLPDYQEIQKELARGIDPDVLTNVVAGIPREQSGVVTQTWTRGVAYLAQILPRRLEARLTGTKLHDPSEGEWAEWGWAWRIANDPLVALDLAGEGILIGAEVGHLVAIYPAIFAAICGALGDALADHAGQDDDWQPPWWLRKQLCTLLQVSPVSRTLVADIEAAIQKSQAETKTQPSKLEITNTGSTPGQRLAEQ